MMSVLKSLSISLVDVVISCKTESVSVHDFSDLMLQIIFDSGHACINVESKRSIALNNSRKQYCGISIYTAELSRPAAQASYMSLVIMVFPIHYNVGPAE